MQIGPTDGNLDALARYQPAQEQPEAAQTSNDWEDEERAEAQARRQFSDREDW